MKCFLTVSLFFGLAHSSCLDLGAADEEKFLLSAPEVMKAGWNARILRHHDLNSDGMEDLAFFNFDRSRIELLYRVKDGKALKRVRPAQKDRWEPPLEDAPYAKEYIFLSDELSTFAFGDLNEDGLVDLVRGSPDDGVFVHFRTKDDQWGKPIEIDSKKLRPDSRAIRAEDKSADEPARLLLFTEQGLEGLDFKGGKPLYPSKLFREDASRANGLHMLDIDGDGQQDWMYSLPGSDRSVRLRLGEPGGFGPELSFDLSLASSFNPVPSEKGEEGVLRFTAIDRLSREAIVYSLPKAEKATTDEFAILNYDVFPKDEKRTSWALADFDGDGRNDVVAATSSKRDVTYLKGRESNGYDIPAVYPSLNGISSLCAIRLSKTQSGLLVLSKDENLVGLSSKKAKGPFSFPSPIPTQGEPIDVLALELDKDEREEVILLVEKKSDFVLETWKVLDEKSFEMTFEMDLGLRRAPTGFFPCLINDDKKVDLLVLSEREPALILLNRGSGEFEQACEDSSIRKSLLTELSPDRLGTSDLTGDGKPELLVAGKGQVRALKWEGEDMVVIEQFNATDPNGDLSSPVFLDLDSNGKNELLYYHSSGYWEALEPTEDKTYQPLYKIEGEPILPQTLFVSSVKKQPSLLVFGKSGIQVIRKSQDDEGIALQVESRYLTDLPKIEYAAVDWGDFNHDGKLDLLCIDGRRHTLEFLAFDRKRKRWESVLHFKVFEENLHYQGKKGSAFEPREGYVVDLNGDERDDIVFLVHDRLLCYYQETP